MSTNLSLSIGLYAPSGRGKTTLALKAFPDGIIYGPRASIRCASYLGINPTHIEATNLRSLVPALQKYGPELAKRGSAFIADDISLLADNEIKLFRKQGLSGWTVWEKWADLLLESGEAARNAPCHVLLLFHESPPKELTRHGVTSIAPGTFSLSGVKATEKLPGMMDTVMRIVHDDTILGANNWPYVLSVEPDPMYVTKDRTNAFPRRFPLNLREPLLEAGYDIPRPKDLQWMEPVVETLATKILKEESDPEFDLTLFFKRSASQITKKAKDIRHVRWVLSDALDRANNRRFQSTLIDTFIDNLVVNDLDDLE